MIVALMGLPATGKSTIAQALATTLSAIVLDKDRTRAAVFDASDIEYSREQDDFCMDIVYRVAGYLLARDPARCIIIDGRTFGRAYQREALCTAAQAMNTPLKIIECVCNDEIARERLATSQHTSRHPAANRDFTLHQQLKADWENIAEPKLVLDTAALSLDECTRQAADFVRDERV